MKSSFQPIVVIALTTLAIGGCDRRLEPARQAPHTETSDPPTRLPSAARIVAFGDVHGDLRATREALRMAGAIDDRDRWIGGDLVLVQTGDQLDRGNEDRAILELFERLTLEAKGAGGAFHVLNGNHELMNAAGDLRYVSPSGFAEFSGMSGLDLRSPNLQGLPPAHRARAAAFRPGGPFAKLLARRNTVVIVGQNVFVHGGVLPEHVSYGLERINREVRSWLRGEIEHPPAEAVGRRGLLWSRHYSDRPDDDDCATLHTTLKRLGAARMIVGHSIQKNGISAACDNRVWRIDVAMSSHYGGEPSVLEIVGDRLIRIIDGEDD